MTTKLLGETCWIFPRFWPVYWVEFATLHKIMITLNLLNLLFFWEVEPQCIHKYSVKKQSMLAFNRLQMILVKGRQVERNITTIKGPAVTTCNKRVQNHIQLTINSIAIICSLPSSLGCSPLTGKSTGPVASMLWLHHWIRGWVVYTKWFTSLHSKPFPLSARQRLSVMEYPLLTHLTCLM